MSDRKREYVEPDDPSAPRKRMRQIVTQPAAVDPSNSRDQLQQLVNATVMPRVRAVSVEPVDTRKRTKVKIGSRVSDARAADDPPPVQRTSSDDPSASRKRTTDGQRAVFAEPSGRARVVTPPPPVSQARAADDPPPVQRASSVDPSASRNRAKPIIGGRIADNERVPFVEPAVPPPAGTAVQPSVLAELPGLDETIRRYVADTYPDEPRVETRAIRSDEWLCILQLQPKRAHAIINAALATPPVQYMIVKKTQVVGVPTSDWDTIYAAVSTRLNAFQARYANDNRFGPTVVQTYHNVFASVESRACYRVVGCKKWTEKFQAHCQQYPRERPESPYFISYVAYLATTFLAANDSAKRRIFWTNIARTFRTLWLT